MADISTFTDLSGNTYNVKDAYARAKYFALDGGTAIPSGDDLNDYKTPGTYTCASSSVAGNIANVPINAAFRMVTMRVFSNINNERYYQLLFPNVSNSSPRIFIRRYNGTWSRWQVISPTISDLDGVVGIDHGGTGQTTAGGAMKAFFDGLTDENIASSRTDCIMVQPLEIDEQYVVSLGTPKRRPLSSLWSFIKGMVIDRYGQTDHTRPTWARGSISSTTGAAINSTTRLRTNIFYPVDQELGFNIDVPEGFKLAAYGYSHPSESESSFKGQLTTNGWATGPVVFQNLPVAVRFVRFVLAKTGNGTITVAEAPSDFSFHRPMPTDTMLSADNNSFLGYGKAADAGAVRDILGLNREFGMTDVIGSYAIGDYVVVGTQLYRVTAAVSAGDDFVEGTNVVATNTLDEIERANSVFGVGDSYVPSGAYAVAGFCTSNTIGFSIVLPKSIGSQVSGVTVNTLKIRVCTSAGYLSGYGNAGASVTGSGYTVTASKRADNVVHIGVNHSNFSSISGGQALTIYINSMDLSFT